MSGKRKRSDDGKSSTNAVKPLSTNGKPLSAIAAARLKAEASAKGVVTPEITVEPVPAPESSSTLPESPVPEFEESEQENDVPVKQLNLKLNNWRNEPQNVLSDTATELTVKLPKHLTIAMIGCFHLKVLRGAININGANIGAMSRDGQQDQYYTAYVPATHPILKIRGLDGTNHVQFINCKEASPLSYNSPLFADIWNVRTEIESNRSFSVITDSSSDSLGRALSPESTPEDWLRAIEDCASSVSITTVVGSPHSGKSTFSRRLVNRHLTGQGKSAKPASAVCYLDLDHSKPEYTPHGQISLVTVKDLNLGPSFTHPSTLPGSQGPETIRAHAIPSHLANYKEYYRSCAEDLFLTYKSLQSRSSAPLPLIINTPAHLYTSDFDILIDLLARCKPHHIIHLSDTAAIDSETATKPHTLQTTSAHYRSTVHELTAQFPTTTPLRSEAELRAMHMQSYFHLKSRQVTYSPTVAMTTWNSQPVSHLAPWEFQYRETPSRTQDFAGFISYAEPVEPSSLFDALNGSVVQIIESTSSAIPSPYTALPRTSKHQIPYFAKDERTGMVEPLNPKTTRFVCTALVRGFDVQRGVVQVLVPRTHEEVLYNVVPERTVMVGGCCEMPEWAYVEDAYAAVGQIPGGRKDAPWVEEKSIVEEMGYLNTVRRVRKFQS